MAEFINVSEFHRVEEAPERFVQFLDSQERLLPTAPLFLPMLAEVERLVDVGCGLGRDTAAISEELGASASVVGVDRSPTMIREARSRHSRGGLHFAVAAAEHLPCRDGSVDAVICARTLQHLADPAIALTEIRRILRSAGTVAVLDVDHGSTVIDCELSDVLARVRSATNRQLSPNVGRALRRLLLRAGFEDVNVEVTARGVPADLAIPYGVLALLTEEAVARHAVTNDEAEALRQWWRRMSEVGDGYAVVLRFVATGMKPTTTDQ